MKISFNKVDGKQEIKDIDPGRLLWGLESEHSAFKTNHRARAEAFAVLIEAAGFPPVIKARLHYIKTINNELEGNVIKWDRWTMAKKRKLRDLAEAATISELSDLLQNKRR